MANHLIKKRRPFLIQPTTPARQSEWPKWYYEKKTGRGAIFRNIDEVPDGWIQDYAKTDKAKEAAKTAGAGDAGMRLSDYYVPEGGGNADEGVDLDEEEEGGSDEPEELEAIDDIEIHEIKKRLLRREIPFASNASKATVYQLLEENWIEE